MYSFYSSKIFTDYISTIKIILSLQVSVELFPHVIQDVNTNTTEFMSYLHVKWQDLVDQINYFGSNISSTESYVNVRRVKAWTDIDRLSIKWKSYPSLS